MIKISFKKKGVNGRPRSKKRKVAEGGKIARALESGISGRWILGAGVFVASVLIISWRGMPLDIPVIGQISERDVTATCAFSFPDRIKTEQSRDMAENHQPVAYLVVQTVPEEKRNALRDFFSRLSSESRPPQSSIMDLVLIPPARSYRYFLNAVIPARWEDELVSILEDAYRNGVLTPDIKRTLSNTRQDEIMLVARGGNEDRVVSISEIPTVSSCRIAMLKEVEGNIVMGEVVTGGLEEVIKWFIEPDLEFDLEKTDALRAAARSDISSVMTEVRKGEKIIRQGEEVRPIHIQKFRSYQEQLFRLEPPISLLYYTLGNGLLVALVFIIAVYYLEHYHREISRSNSRLLLISAVVILILLLSRLLRQVFWHIPPGMMEFTRYISPVTIGTLLLCLLVSVRVAIFFTLILSLLAALILGGGPGYIVVVIIGSIAGVFGLSGARRRIDLFRAGLISAVAALLAVAGIGVAGGLELKVFLIQGLGAALAGIISAFFALIALGLFESLFRVSSDIGLLELSDLNHPLLRRLMIRAPGTYHHGLMVATLAEGAAEEIGANSLLSRIGSYFHDVGKIAKPEYFSENETSGSSRHDTLIPSMSSLILVAHVKEGVDLARQYKLDRRIVAIIEQHHGTSLISCFYDRAGRNRQLKFDVMETDYRYPGPRPQSREAAIVMLADAVEAASAALDRRTPSRLESLIDNIIRDRFSDGQLDECRLTMVDLKKIGESFVRLLSARYHTRVKYPEVGSGQ
jgi:cyclic-di-AMP phosphodiesterase PgpH